MKIEILKMKHGKQKQPKSSENLERLEVKRSNKVELKSSEYKNKKYKAEIEIFR